MKPLLQITLKYLTVLFVVFVLNNRAKSQDKVSIKGKVIDVDSEPLPGASIIVLGTTKGVLTDSDGLFDFQDLNKNDQLVFSYIGMRSDTIEVIEEREIEMILYPLGDKLDEFTVVAFGEQKKESVVGAITTIKPDELKVPSSNLTTALAGRLAGLISFQRSGEPGADNADFFIRGVTSFGFSNSPLILIDGIEMSSEELARLQVDDLESFSLMKDATATALYGARGANGVVLITTKEGVEGKAKISFRVEESMSEPTRSISLADPITYMELANEASATRGNLLVPYTQEKVDFTRERRNPLLYPTTDWYSMLLKNRTFNNRYNLSIRGGGKAAQYYVAATYNKDNGMLKVDKHNNFNNNIDLRTYGLRSNTNINITKTTVAKIKLYATWTDYTGPLGSGADYYNQVMHANPVLFPAFYEKDTGNINTDHILFGNSDAGQYLNPYANLMRGYRTYTNSMYMAQFELKQDLSFILKGLSISGMYNTNRHNFYQVSRFYNPYYYDLASYDRKTGDYSLTLLNPESAHEFLDYVEDGKDIQSEDYFRGILSYSENFRNNDIGGSLVFTAKNRVAANPGSLQNSLPQRNVGMAGRLTYSYGDKYFIEGNFGYNGSERFARDHRFGFFPSIGAAWFISRESFWKVDENFISKLKLRGSYGLVGNDAIGDINDRFFYLSQIDPNNSGAGYAFGSEMGNKINGIAMGRYGNDMITWETSTKSNLSMEAEFMRGDISLTVDLYEENRRNILMTRSFTPNTLGVIVLPKASVGTAKSRGMDVALEMNKVITNDFFISGRANLTYAVGKYLNFDEPDYAKAGVPWLTHMNQPIGQTFGFIAERLFIDDEEAKNSPEQFGNILGGDIKYRDINGDGKITNLDRVPIGYPTTPQITYGFGFSTIFKKVDFSFFFQGSGNSSFWIDQVNTAPFISRATGQNNQLLEAYAKSHWSEENRDLYALWPRLDESSNDNNNQTSTWFMRNGAFLRMKQIELGYSFSKNIIKKVGLEKARLYVNGTNLFNFSNFNLWDVEMGGNGLGYPLQRVINVGFNCTF